MDESTQKAIAAIAERNRADLHVLRARIAPNVIRRAVCLELLEQDQLPEGEFWVVIECSLRPHDGASGDDNFTVTQQLADLEARCRLVLKCADSWGDDIVLMRGEEHYVKGEEALGRIISKEMVKE